MEQGIRWVCINGFGRPIDIVTALASGKAGDDEASESDSSSPTEHESEAESRSAETEQFRVFDDKDRHSGDDAAHRSRVKDHVSNSDEDHGPGGEEAVSAPSSHAHHRFANQRSRSEHPHSSHVSRSKHVQHRGSRGEQAARLRGKLKFWIMKFY